MAIAEDAGQSGSGANGGGGARDSSTAGAGGSSGVNADGGRDARVPADADAQVVGPSQDAGDGAPGKPDECPDDPNKLTPGQCGCGVPEVSTPTLADCHVLKSKLIHRYDFEGSGTPVKDRIGTANGSVMGATQTLLDGHGVVLLGGGNAGAYVDLPNGLVSSLKDATLEAWVTWGGGNAWQRIFDFGDTTNATPENNPGQGKTYLFLTPKSGDGVVVGGYSLSGTAGEVHATAPGRCHSHSITSPWS